MQFCDPFAGCQANARAGIFAFAQALKHLKYPFSVLHRDTDPIVTNGEYPFLLLKLGRYMNTRQLLTTKLYGVCDEVLQQLSQQHWIGHHSWENVMGYHRATLHD